MLCLHDSRLCCCDGLAILFTPWSLSLFGQKGSQDFICVCGLTLVSLLLLVRRGGVAGGGAAGDLIPRAHQGVYSTMIVALELAQPGCGGG